VRATASAWILFNLGVLAMLLLDLGVLRRESRVVTPRQATVWTGIWVALSLLFCAGLWRFYAPERALEFLTGYVIEYGLSVDNLFVFLVVFSHFQVAPEYRHRILFWGIIGAFIMRATLIVAGAALVARFHWLLYLFGAFLLYTAWKMLRGGDEEELDPERSGIFKLARRVLPVSSDDDRGHFFTRQHGKRMVTPVFLVLMVVEASDLLFALDSIPAVLGVSRDPFVIYTSNVCAILGLRSLFFLVASLMDKFRYLKVGLSIVLAFVGLKMLLSWAYEVPLPVSLGVIFLVLGGSIAVSALRPPPEEDAPQS
jgi:tellurite resistance protein TerC